MLGYFFTPMKSASPTGHKKIKEVQHRPISLSRNLKDLDDVDLAIIKDLSEDGRKSFVKIAQKVGLTPVAVKKRVERLLKRNILKIQARLTTEKFCSASATISLSATPAIVTKLIKKFKNCPLVYNLTKIYDHRDLIIDIVVPDIKRIKDFIEKQIKSNPEIKHFNIDLGDTPIVPRTHSLPHFVDHSKKCPCENKCKECEYFL